MKHSSDEKIKTVEIEGKSWNIYVIILMSFMGLLVLLTIVWLISSSTMKEKNPKSVKIKTITE